jgi:hypothetical protein
MLVYVTLFIASLAVALVAIWFYRILFGVAHKSFKYQSPNSNHYPTKKLGQTRYDKKRRSKPANLNAYLARRDLKPQTAVSQPIQHRRPGLSGSAYRPSQKARSTFALDTSSD